MRKDLNKHLTTACPNRDYKCAYCGEEGTYATITQIHDEICQKKAIPCTNTECPQTLQRQHIAQHVESKCKYTVIACQHKSIGCETELKRKDMAAHELDDQRHLHMAINTVTLLKETTTQLKEDITQLREQLRETMGLLNENCDITLKQGESMNIRLVDYEKRKASKKEFTSPSFYTSHGYHMALRVYANGNGVGEGTHVSVFALIVEGKHDSQLSWPLLGSVTITLLNQLEDKKHHTRVGDNWGLYKFIPHSALGHDPIENTQYLKDDTLYFRVLVEGNKPWLPVHRNM